MVLSRVDLTRNHEAFLVLDSPGVLRICALSAPALTCATLPGSFKSVSTMSESSAWKPVVWYVPCHLTFWQACVDSSIIFYNHKHSRVVLIKGKSIVSVK